MAQDDKNLITDYCPFDCPRKKYKVFFCMKRFLKSIETYCPLFTYTQEERLAFFKKIEEKGEPEED
jgi:hypothetical protein